MTRPGRAVGRAPSRRSTGGAPRRTIAGDPVRHGFNRLAAWQRAGIYVSGSALLATGIAWLVLHYGRANDALPSPLEPWTMRWHGLAGFVALFMLGGLAVSHIPRGWRHGRRHGRSGQRVSGTVLCALAAALVFTGYLLYYFAPDTIRPALGWLHSGLGVAMAALVIGHRRPATTSDSAAHGDLARPDSRLHHP